MEYPFPFLNPADGKYYMYYRGKGKNSPEQTGLLVGDAATRIKHTLMFDLPIIDKAEAEALMKADAFGGGKRTAR